MWNEVNTWTIERVLFSRSGQGKCDELLKLFPFRSQRCHRDVMTNSDSRWETSRENWYLCNVLVNCAWSNWRLKPDSLRRNKNSGKITNMVGRWPIVPHRLEPTDAMDGRTRNLIYIRENKSKPLHITMLVECERHRSIATFSLSPGSVQASSDRGSIFDDD